MKDRLDDLKFNFSKGEWELPVECDGIDNRWRDAFICVRLQDVLARRFYGMPFPKLSTEDRTIIRGRCEFFLAQMSAVMEGDEE